MATLQTKRDKNRIHRLKRGDAESGDLTLFWLGQAGFMLTFAGKLFMIDPYLSDFLSKKYKGKKFSHKRMTPSPVAPVQIKEMDWVLCSHKHSDHMDPETLLPLLQNTNCQFVVPNAVSDRAIEIGIPKSRILGVNAGRRYRLAHDITLFPIPSAHEELVTNDLGEHHFLGFILDFGGIRLYHSGDCRPYGGLEKKVAEANVDVALLPVNGRDEYRKANGIPGNFLLAEAMALCDAAGVPTLLGHHFGMFDFNTIDPKQAAIEISKTPHRCNVTLTELDVAYIVKKA